jgi:outer membrane protein assembly factor BamD (BamD/ComL family)
MQDVTPRARATAPSDDAALLAEIALLDRARNALRERASARAVALLEQHARRFARGELAPEAAALRIEALVQRGSHAEAEALAQRFVRAYPNHPLSAQVSRLTQASESP